eukprot:3411455-Rhodomonas_salina.2
MFCSRGSEISDVISTRPTANQHPRLSQEHATRLLHNSTPAWHCPGARCSRSRKVLLVLLTTSRA